MSDIHRYDLSKLAQGWSCVKAAATSKLVLFQALLSEIMEKWRDLVGNMGANYLIEHIFTLFQLSPIDDNWALKAYNPNII